MLGNKIITLTTDFGYRDSYVGTMKGVILSQHRDVTIVDITHGITSHSVLEASFALTGSYAYFPEGTLHVVVVDPGVGGTRRIIYLENSGHRFLAPDNGVLSGMLKDADLIYSIENEEHFLPKVSHTFHGRDIFAPLAAKLCAGLDPAELGPRLEDAYELEWPEPGVEKGSVEGCVLYIDVFGNLVTNIKTSHLTSLSSKATVFLKGDEIGSPRRSYVACETGAVLALINSYGLLEIAVREGSAEQRFSAGTGDEVIVSNLS